MLQFGSYISMVTSCFHSPQFFIWFLHTLCSFQVIPRFCPKSFLLKTCNHSFPVSFTSSLPAGGFSELCHLPFPVTGLNILFEWSLHSQHFNYHCTASNNIVVTTPFSLLSSRLIVPWVLWKPLVLNQTHQVCPSCISYLFNDVITEKWKSESEVLSCVRLCDTMDCSPPGSSIHGIFQARGLEWVYHFLPQGIFLTQGSNLGLPNCKQTLYHLSHQGSPTETDHKGQNLRVVLNGFLPLRYLNQINTTQILGWPKVFVRDFL